MTLQRRLLASSMAAVSFFALACSGEGRNSDSKAQVNGSNSSKDPGVDKQEQEECERRREQLRKSRGDDDARRAKADASYRLAKAEYFGTVRMKGARGLADRLPAVARAEYEKVVKEYPGTLAARDAKDLLDGKQPPERSTPDDPDNVKAIPPVRFSSLEQFVDLASIGEFGSPLQQIPATVVDKGVLKHVPYQSFRAGGYEFNVYGDPDSPACLEVGIDKTLFGKTSAKQNCLTFLLSVLPDAGDRCLLKSLNLSKDIQKRAGVTFEVTPQTAEDAYGCWWISVYDSSALNTVRVSTQELAAITVPRTSAPASADNAQHSWAPSQLALSRPGGNRVFVHSYTRKDGTFVQAHTRSSTRRR